MPKRAIIIFFIITLSGCVVVPDAPHPPPVKVEQRFACYYDCGWEEVCCYPEYYRDDVEGVCYPMLSREVDAYCY